MRLSSAAARAAVLLLVLVASGCGTMRNGRGWGQDAIFPFDWKRIPQAARRAALDPLTWAPAAGALVVSVDDFDRRASDWAVKQHPVFGDGASAGDASDRLRDALLAEVLVTGLLTPGGRDPGPWVVGKVKGGLLEEGALLSVNVATSAIKDLTGRERPGGLDRRSFPSGHTSMAFAGARLSNRNLDAIDMPGALRSTLQSVNLAAAATVGWARVEGERHYPADALAGAALGNFLAVFVHDALIGIPREDMVVGFEIEPAHGGIRCALSWEF